MPIYEYEPIGFPCTICDERFEVIQGIDEPALEFCPTCGLPCKRLVSRATFKLSREVSPDKAAKRGFTTWKRAGKGTWEKVGGEGVDVIQGTPEQIAHVEAEKKEKSSKKKLDLDKQSDP